MSEADIARTTLTITGADFDPIVQELVHTGTQWKGTIGDIPAGTGRTFVAKAYDGANHLIFSGTASGVTIVAGQTAQVALLLQQSDAPVPFANAAPKIDAFFTSSTEVAPGGTLAFRVVAHDDNPGDILTYAWSVSAGSLSTTSNPMTVWTAPNPTGLQTITITVTDQKGAVATMSVQVDVTDSAAVGSAQIGASFNTWPQISSISATPTRIDLNETTNLATVIDDEDGDALSYAWSSSCSGSFGDASAANTSYTLSAVPVSGKCTLTLAVTDGRGGSTTGTISLTAGPAPTPDEAPAIDDTFQSVPKVAANQTVVLRVEAHDPEGTLLGFAWNASTGAASAATNTATTSEITWTAPAGFTGSASVTVTITDADGGTTDQVFTIDAVGECVNCDFESFLDGWTYTDSAGVSPMNQEAVNPGWGWGGVYAINHAFGALGVTGVQELSQDMVISANFLKYFYYAETPGSAARSFSIVIEPVGGGTPLQTTLVHDNSVVLPFWGGGQFQLDVSAFVGQPVRVKFVWQTTTNVTPDGYGYFRLDSISFEN